MTRNKLSASLAICAALWLSGCTGPAGGGAYPPIDPAQEHATLREWRSIYTVEVTGAQPQRTLAGYLCHEYTLADREGKHLVYDTARQLKGFVTATGRAYVCEKNVEGDIESREVAYEGLDDGVLRILGTSGRVEYETFGEKAAVGETAAE